MNKKEYKYDIAILRLFAITVVVAFHGYGMTFVHFSDSVNGLYHKIYYHFNQTCFINVAMPLFVWISGYLFGMELIRNTPAICSLITKKTQRILVPYIVFTLLFMLTTDSFAWDPLWRGGYWHLWFLPMLFWCFLITYMIHRLIKPTVSHYISILLAALFFGAIFIPIKLPSIIGLDGVKNWYCWFYLGYISFHYDAAIISFIRKTHSAALLFAIFVAIQVISPTLYENCSIWKLVASASAIYALWYLARRIDWQNYRVTRILIALSACSFGIYIFHNWIEMYSLSKTAQKIFPIEDFALHHIFLFPIMFVGLTLVISLSLTYLIRLTKFGRKLL